MDKRSNGLMILVIILTISVLGLGGYLIYDKAFSKEEKVETQNNSNDNVKGQNEINEVNNTKAENTEVKTIQCISPFNHQYGAGMNSLTYYYKNQELTKLDLKVVYNFENETTAKSMVNNSLMTDCDKKECKTVQQGALILKSLTIDYSNSSDINNFKEYKNITISDLLNNNISENNITNNQNSVCVEITE